ncbi:MAG: response regulator [Planctomycetota bacterium]
MTATPTDAKHQKVLIVDDEPMNRDILEEILEDEFILDYASSGEEALEQVEAFQPDLVILDIMMPGIDGYETCRRLRGDSRFHFTKVILVSAKALVAERLEGYAAGADDFVTKPFNPQELLAKARVFARLKSLEEVDRLRSDILGLFSHEIRTPLSGILGPAEVLLDPDAAADVEERTTLLTVIHESGLRIQHYFERLLLLFQLRSSSFRLGHDVVSVDELIETGVAERQSSAAERNVTIQQTVEPGLYITGDQHHLEMALSILLDNAVRFSPDGESVQISVERVEEQVCISVVDNGPGVDAGIQGALLEGCVVQGLNNHQRGTGMSLAVAQHVARQHGGALELESEIGTGSCFRFHVPFEPTPVLAEGDDDAGAS